MSSYSDDGCTSFIFKGALVFALFLGISIAAYNFFEQNKDILSTTTAFLIIVVIILLCAVVCLSIILYNKLKKLKSESKLLKEEVTKSSNLYDKNKKLEEQCTALEKSFLYQKKQLENSIQSQKKQFEKEKNLFEKEIREKDELYRLIEKQNNSSINKITSLYADFLLLQYSLSEKYLKTKIRPAFTEASRIAELKKETKKYVEQYRIMLYKYEELLNLFPELKDYADDFESLKELENIKNINQLQDEYDKVRDYISKEDYQKLTMSERNQRALDGYIKGKNKSNWQIGRDYELYIGHWLRARGYKVWHYGIEKKLEDLGCDIIAVKNNKVHIIQCKRWKEERKIHEKHIIHLYGTYILLKRNYKEILNIGLFNETVIANFISTHQVTDTAKEIAKILNIGLDTIQFQEFPRIKCNINNGEKIYHLPFDQQYDRTKIEKEGEFYAMTVKDAESKGFRRAFRYNFNS
jgi:hypothetical protein